MYAPDDSGVVVSGAGDADSFGAGAAEVVTCEVSVIMVGDRCSCALWSPEAISLRGVSKISKMKNRTPQPKRNYKPCHV